MIYFKWSCRKLMHYIFLLSKFSYWMGKFFTFVGNSRGRINIIWHFCVSGSSHVHTGASVEMSPLLYNWPRFDRFSAIWVASGEGKSCNKKSNQRLLSDKISEFNPLWLCFTTTSYFHIELTIGSDLDSTISTLL